MKSGQALGIVTSLLLSGVIWALVDHVSGAYRPTPDEDIVISSALPGTNDSGPLPAEPILALPLIEDVYAIIERPIFSQSRRPVEIIAEVPESSPAPTLEIDLVGVVIWQTERFAFVRSKQDNSIIKINEGANVAGWVAIGIGPEHVLFRQGDREQELRLSYKSRDDNG